MSKQELPVFPGLVWGCCISDFLRRVPLKAACSRVRSCARSLWKQGTRLLLAPACDLGCRLGCQTDVLSMSIAAAKGFRQRAMCEGVLVLMLQRPEVVGCACSHTTPVSIFLPTDIEDTVSIYPVHHEKWLPFFEGCA